MVRLIHPELRLCTVELAARFRIAKEAAARSRWHFLWTWARGFTARAIAGITGYSDYRMGQIARRYNARGPKG